MTKCAHCGETHCLHRSTPAAGPWIPMTERKPPYEKYVLIYGRGHSTTPDVRRLVKGEKYDSWYNGGLHESGATHWAWLEPPEGQELASWCRK